MTKVSNVNVSVSETGAVEVTAMIGKGKAHMSAIVVHEVSGRWVYTRYTVVTSEGFAITGDAWDVERKAEEDPLAKMLFTVAKGVLLMNNPEPKPAEEGAEA
jgi:hypothetical protein